MNHLVPQERYGKTGGEIKDCDVMSAAMYPQVFDEYREHVAQYSVLTSKLNSNAFFHPMEEDDEVEVEISPGQSVVVKFKARHSFGLFLPAQRSTFGRVMPVAESLDVAISGCR